MYPPVDDYLLVEVGNGLADLPHEQGALFLGQVEVGGDDLFKQFAAVEKFGDQTNFSENLMIYVWMGHLWTQNLIV